VHKVIGLFVFLDCFEKYFLLLAIVHVISVMDYCLKQRNLSDVMGLVTALQSTSLVSFFCL
jgi:hypothetical protein